MIYEDLGKQMISFSFFNNAVSTAKSDSTEWDGKMIVNVDKNFDKGDCDQFEVTTFTFAWKEWGKPQKSP